MWDPYVEFDRIQLDNGLTIHASHWDDRPWEKIKFLIHSGAKDDFDGYEGLAHFLEHVVSENTKLGADKITAWANRFGGYANLGSTGRLSTSYKFFLPLNKLRQGLNIFGNMLITSQITKPIETERSIIHNEFRRKYMLDLDYQVNKHRHQMLYPNHWLETKFSTLGSTKSIDSISHRELQLFYDQHYTPANISIIAAGGLTTKQLVKMIEASPLGLKKDGQRNAHLKPLSSFSSPLENLYEFKISDHVDFFNELKHGYFETHLVIPGEQNIYAVNIVKNMLRQVLWDELRIKRGWSYATEVDMDYYNDIIHLYINCHHLSAEALTKIKNIIDNLLAKILDNKKYFERFKKEALARTTMLDSSVSDILNNVEDDIITHDKIFNIKEGKTNTQSVNFEDLQKLKDFFAPKNRWSIIGIP